MEASSQGSARVSRPRYEELLDATRAVLERMSVADRMTISLSHEQHMRVAAHMRKALGLDYRNFSNIYERYRLATASPCSLEAFYLSLQNMCDAARRAPELHTDYVRMISSDGLIRCYQVALPRAVPLVVVAQVVEGDLFGAMFVLEQSGRQEPRDEQERLAASSAVQLRGLRWRMQCTMGYGYMERMTATCDAYHRDSGIRLSHEQLYMGLMSLCHEAGEFGREACIERLSADVLQVFTQAVQVQGVVQGMALGGIQHYFVRLPAGNRFALLARRQGNDPFDRVAILYNPGWQQIGDACECMLENRRPRNIGWW